MRSRGGGFKKHSNRLVTFDDNGTTPGEHVAVCHASWALVSPGLSNQPASLASARQLLIHNPRKSGEMGRQWPESSVAGLSNRVRRLRGTPRQPGQPRMGPCATYS